MAIDLHLWNSQRPALLDDEHTHLVKYRWRLDKSGYVIRYCERTIYRTTERGEKVKRVQRREKLSHAVGGVPPAGFVWDHINRDRLDNRTSNLRLIPAAANAQNRSAHKCNVTGLRGVHFRKDTKRYLAHARLKGKNYRLGYFDTPEEAAEVAKRFRIERMPYTVEG